MRKILIGAILFTVCLSACKTPKKTIVETHTEYIEVLKDTTIFLPADSSSVRALLQCDSLGNIYIKEIETLQGKVNSTAKVTIKDNYIIADCKCDSMSIYFQYKERHYKETTKETDIQYVEKELKWWQTALMFVGVLMILFVVVKLLLK